MPMCVILIKVSSNNARSTTIQHIYPFYYIK